MAAWWDALSDGELRARLLNRGVPPNEARALVHHRELDGARERIAEVLA